MTRSDGAQTMSPEPGGTRPNAIVRDLALLADQARWAHTHGYWKEGHGLDAERGMDLSRTEQQRETGPTFDLEIGSHPARQAYQHAVAAVHSADVVLAALARHEGIVLQPIIVPLDAFSHPRDLVRAANRATWRAARIEGDHPKLKTIRSELDRAVRGLSKALDNGTADLEVAQADKGIPQHLRCRICGWRRYNPKLAGRCSTCWKWFKRKGEERPKHLDGISPVEAKKKRLARGESWGVG